MSNYFIRPIDVEQACKEGNIEILKTADSNFKWHRKNSKYQSYIDIAIEFNQIEIVNFLTDKGLISSPKEDVLTKEVKKRIEKICYDISMNSNTKLLDLQLCVRRYSYHLSTKFIKNRYNIVDYLLILFSSERKITEDEYYSILEYLLENGANPNDCIFLIIENENNINFVRNIINLLLKYGLELNILLLKCVLKRFNQLSDQSGIPGFLDFLKEKGMKFTIDADILDNIYADIGLLQYFINNGVSFKKNDIMQMIVKSCRYCNIRSYQFLMSLSMIDWNDNLGFFSIINIFHALFDRRLIYKLDSPYNLIAIFENLIDKNIITYDITDENGYCALYYAIASKDKILVEYLLDFYIWKINDKIKDLLVSLKDEIIVNLVLSKMGLEEDGYLLLRIFIHDSEKLNTIISKIDKIDKSKAFNLLCNQGLYQFANMVKDDIIIDDDLLLNICSKNLPNKKWIETIKFLLDIKPTLIRECDFQGNNVLHLFLKNKNSTSEILELLIEYGADVDKINKNGHLPIHYINNFNSNLREIFER